MSTFYFLQNQNKLRSSILLFKYNLIKHQGPSSTSSSLESLFEERFDDNEMLKAIEPIPSTMSLTILFENKVTVKYKTYIHQVLG